MPKYIKTDKYQNNIFLTLSLDKQIMEGTFEHIIQYMVDNKIDMSAFEKKIKNDKTGRPAWDPKVMLKIILFSYSRGIISSREIELFCRENMVMAALAENSIPDFTVIADFISEMKEEIKGVFVNVLLVASEMNLLDNTAFALDGCKIKSNASKEYSGKFSDLEKKAAKIEERIKYLLDTHNENDKKMIIKPDEKIKETIAKLEKKAEKIKKFIRENRKKKGKRTEEIQSNITDNDSAKMKTSHGAIQGYNGQALVDDKHQVIVAAEVFGQGSDNDLLSPMIKEAKDNFKSIGKDENYMKGKMVIADTGYFSETNLAEAEKNELDAYIPDQLFRKRDLRFKDKNRFNPEKKKAKYTREDFVYEESKDIYICKNGKELRRQGKEYKIKNWTYKRYVAKQSECKTCEYRGDCLEKESTKRRVLMLQVRNGNRNICEEMMTKIDTPSGREIYSKRMQIVEPVFANIRIHKKLNCFTLRGKEKVNIQWLLFCIVHNLGKIMKYGQILQSV